MQILLESPNQPDIIRLIDELDAYQKPLYPPESHHGIDIAALSAANVLFAVARNEEGHAIGCGAIVVGPEFGELKRMFVRPGNRGQGIAMKLLGFLEDQAAAKGCTTFMLETGPSQPEALSLYARAGYELRGPFGSYGPDPFSVFMEKGVGRNALV